MKDSSVTL